MVLPASILLLLVLMLPTTLFVAAVGLLAGYVASVVLGTPRMGVGPDALLAVVAFWIVFWIVLASPCPGCVFAVDGGTIRNQIPYPLAWAVAAAILGPLGHQLYRYGRRKVG
jgi:hypothetical protein